GEGLVEHLVDMELEAARALPRALPLLLRVLHAPLLARGRPEAVAHVRRLRALRRGADPDQLPRHPARAGLHPPRRLLSLRAADERFDVRDVLRLLGGGDAARVRPLPGRAPRQESRRGYPGPPRRARDARAAPRPRGDGSRLVSQGGYLAAAYAVVF